MQLATIAFPAFRVTTALPASGETCLITSPGATRIAIGTPTGVTITYPAAGYHQLTISSNRYTVNFGFTFGTLIEVRTNKIVLLITNNLSADVTVSGYVWDDLTYDGINDAGEPPMVLRAWRHIYGSQLILRSNAPGGMDNL